MRNALGTCLPVPPAALVAIIVLLATAPLPPGASLLAPPAARAQVSAGAAVAFSTYLGGNGGDVAAGVALDSAGNIYVTGRTRSTTFPLARPYQATPVRGGFDTTEIFVTKFSPDGRTLLYSTYLGGKELDRANAIAVDSQGQAVITGLTTSPDFPTANARFPNYTNQGDAFVLKLSADGQRLVYSTYLGGNGLDD
jgi:hypothetical protein